MTRLFDAPRHLVFEAMTKPEHIVRWWGRLGEGYSVPVCEVDLRPGGAWRHVNRHPGGEAAFHGVYREIAPPERLVYTEIFEPFEDAPSLVTMSLTEEQGKTRLTVTARSEEHTSELQSLAYLVCRLLLEKKKKKKKKQENLKIKKKKKRKRLI